MFIVRFLRWQECASKDTYFKIEIDFFWFIIQPNIFLWRIILSSKYGILNTTKGLAIYTLSKHISFTFRLFSFANSFCLVIDCIIVVNTSSIFDSAVLESPFILSGNVFVCNIHIVEWNDDPDWIEEDKAEPEKANVRRRERETAISKKDTQRLFYKFAFSIFSKDIDRKRKLWTIYYLSSGHTFSNLLRYSSKTK